MSSEEEQPPARPWCLPGCERIDGHDGRDSGACTGEGGVVLTPGPLDLVHRHPGYPGQRAGTEPAALAGWGGTDMSEPDEFADYYLRSKILGAYGLHEWDISSAPAPWRVRFWRAVSFAKRRGKVIDWRSYEAAEAELRESEAKCRADMSARLAAFEAHLNGMLAGSVPEGMRFEWTVDGEQ